MGRRMGPRREAGDALAIARTAVAGHAFRPGFRHAAGDRVDHARLRARSVGPAAGAQRQGCGWALETAVEQSAEVRKRTAGGPAGGGRTRGRRSWDYAPA